MRRPTPSPSDTGLQYGPVLLHNIRDVRPGPEGLLLGRLPPAVQPAVEATTRERAGRGTGCELRFRLRSGEAVIRLRTAAMDDRPENGLVEVWHAAFPADFSRSPVPVGPQWRELRIRLPEHVFHFSDFNCVINMIQRYIATVISPNISTIIFQIF